MTQKNDEVTGFLIALSFVGAIAAVMAAFVFAVVAFLSLGMTVLCLLAWNRSITVFGAPLHPHEAHRFVRNGLIGMAVVPAFILFAAAMFGLKIDPQIWVYALIGGYAGGSVLPEVQRAQEEKAREDALLLLPPQIQPNRPPAREERTAQLPAAPFRFASWDDEEKRS